MTEKLSIVTNNEGNVVELRITNPGLLGLTKLRNLTSDAMNKRGKVISVVDNDGEETEILNEKLKGAFAVLGQGQQGSTRIAKEMLRANVAIIRQI